MILCMADTQKLVKPDLVIIDRMEKKMDILELTVPLETNIKTANTEKMTSMNILSQI